MSFRFLRLTPAGEWTGREVWASCLAEAQAKLGSPHVVSAASYAIPAPRPLPAGRCRGCGVRDKAHADTPYCEKCGLSVERSRSSRSRARLGPKPRKPSRDDSKRRAAREPSRRAKIAASMRAAWARRKAGQ